MEKKRLNSPKYKKWVYLFLFFEFIFVLLNLHGGWDLIGALIRSTISATVMEFLFYIVYVLFKKEEKSKGKFFDERDSKR